MGGSLAIELPVTPDRAGANPKRLNSWEQDRPEPPGTYMGRLPEAPPSNPDQGSRRTQNPGMPVTGPHPGPGPAASGMTLHTRIGSNGYVSLGAMCPKSGLVWGPTGNHRVLKYGPGRPALSLARTNEGDGEEEGHMPWRCACRPPHEPMPEKVPAAANIAP